MVRTSGFQPENRGSIPLGGTTRLNQHFKSSTYKLLVHHPPFCGSIFTSSSSSPCRSWRGSFGWPCACRVRPHSSRPSRKSPSVRVTSRRCRRGWWRRSMSPTGHAGHPALVGEPIAEARSGEGLAVFGHEIGRVTRWTGVDRLTQLRPDRHGDFLSGVLRSEGELAIRLPAAAKLRCV